MKELVDPAGDVIESQFAFCCVWAFGSTLDVDSRDVFSDWWTAQFGHYLDYPHDGTASRPSVHLAKFLLAVKSVFRIT